MDRVDWALLLLRVVFGASLVAHGLNKVRGPRGLAGTTAWFSSIGMLRPAVQARVASGTEIVAGALLCVGLFTSVAASATVALMLVAVVTVHWKVGYFIFLPNGGWEYCAGFAAVAAALATAGPGRLSLDHAANIVVGGAAGALLVVAGAALAVVHLLLFHRPVRDG